VRDQQGEGFEISVGIDPAATVQIWIASKGRISRENSYWLACAERHLAEYLSEHDDCPPDCALRIEILTPCDLELVYRWETT
jgi:hypothetical protein